MAGDDRNTQTLGDAPETRQNAVAQRTKALSNTPVFRFPLLLSAGRIDACER
jgi:hypothetical protein